MGWGDVFKVIGVGIDILSGSDEAKSNTAWARYNRDRDVIDLHFFKERTRDQIAIDRMRLGHIQGTDRAILSMEEDIADVTETYFRNQRNLAIKTSDHEADRLYKTKMARFGTELAQVRASKAKTSATRANLAQQRNVLDTEDMVRSSTLDARRESLDVSQRALGAARTELAVTTAARRAEVREGAQREIGAAFAGEAFRGMEGSFGRTEEIRIGAEATREMGVIEAQRGAAAGRLDVQQSSLELERVNIAGDRALGDARSQMRRTAIRGESAVTAAQEGVQRRQEAEIRTGRGFVQDEADLIRARGAQEAGRAGLSEAQARLQGVQVTQKKERKDIEEQTVKDRIEHGEISIGIADHSLESMPELPDYEGAAGMNAAGRVLSLGAELID